MGGSESAVGHLHVQLENPNIQAGQEVTGVVHLKLDSDITAESLSLKFTGKEYCYWTESRSESNSDGSSSTVTDVYTGKALVIKQHFPVFIFANSHVAAGQYSFPFSFITPPGLLGSFHVKHGDAKGHIKYHITAYIRSQSHVKKSKAEVHIIHIVTQPITAISGQTFANISTWCCFSQGSVQVSAFVNKSGYVPGELAEIEAEINNSKSRLAVTDVRCTLFRTIRFRSDQGRPFVLKTTVNEVVSHQFVPPGNSLDGDLRVKLALLVKDAKEELQNATTVSGQKVECVYTICIRAVMDGSCMCCGQTPSVERELLIYPMQQANILPPPIPENWHPMVMPVAQLHYEPGYQPSAPPLPTQV